MKQSRKKRGEQSCSQDGGMENNGQEHLYFLEAGTIEQEENVIMSGSTPVLRHSSQSLTKEEKTVTGKQP